MYINGSFKFDLRKSCDYVGQIYGHVFQFSYYDENARKTPGKDRGVVSQ
jgi:hypothetical protein